MDLNGNATDYRGDFIDREDAGRRLAKALTRYKDRQPAVLALPRGGVPVDLGIGAGVDGPHPQRILHQHVADSLRVTPDRIEAETRRQLEAIEEHKRLYRVRRPPVAAFKIRRARP